MKSRLSLLESTVPLDGFNLFIKSLDSVDKTNLFGSLVVSGCIVSNTVLNRRIVKKSILLSCNVKVNEVVEAL